MSRKNRNQSATVIAPATVSQESAPAPVTETALAIVETLAPDAALVNKDDQHAEEVKGAQVVERGAETLAECIAFDEFGNASFKADTNVRPSELVILLESQLKSTESKTVQALNTLRLARTMKDVYDGTAYVPAFVYVCRKLQDKYPAKGSAFANVLYYLSAADLIDANNLKGNVFSVAPALGVLKKLGAIGEGGKLLVGEGSLAGPIVDLLKNGTAQAKVVSACKKLRDDNPDKFPRSERTKALPSTVKTEEDSADKISAALRLIAARMDALLSKGETAKLRAVWMAEVQTVAKLTGLDTAEIKA